MKNQNKNIAAIFYAVGAALFYAVNAPCSKLLLETVEPVFMAAFLYLGAGFGVGIPYLFHRRNEKKEERLNRKDIPYTIGMVALDIIAPILLLLGIRVGTSANASLLGNFEIAATTLIALLFFREKVSKRLWAGIGFITLSSIMLSFDGGASLKFSIGSLFVLGAAVCWGLENNCTRSISEKSAYQIVTVKGFCSGTGSLVTALLIGEKFPAVWDIPLAMLLGFVAYGLSIFTYVRAQKTLGAAKTSAYYAFAPFIGALLSFLLLREKLSAGYLAALLVMLAGTGFVVYDTLAHSHSHMHAHTFVHTHDGTTHTHTVEHTHTHRHYISDEKHAHSHRLEELEQSAEHIRF